MIRLPRRARRSVLAMFVAIVMAFGIAPAMAAEEQARLKLVEFDSLVVVSGKGFSSGSVKVVATAGAAKGSRTLDVTSNGRFLIAFEPAETYVGDVIVTATSADANVTATIAFGSGTDSTTTSALPTTTSVLPTTSIPTTSTSVPATTTTAPRASTTTVAPSNSSGTWASGASGDGVANGSFAAWRGSPVTATTFWCDNSEDNAVNCYNIKPDGNLRDFKGVLDIAPGGMYGNETWADAASGKLDARFHKMAQNLAANAINASTVYVRPFHEMDGNWYKWSVNAGNVADFKKGWIRFHDILAADFPEAKLVLNVNKDAHSGITTEQLWPGDAYVDVYGVDFYDMWPSYPTQEAWDKDLMSGGVDSPKGLEAHKAFAKKHGKPMSFPEWGLNNDGSQGGDHPLYIKNMNTFFRTNAGSGPGQVLYETYFNVPHGGVQNFMIYPSNKNPLGAAMYKSLKWGS